jgi:hypothetical protein
MTTVLEKKIYELVTKSENFEIAFEIHEKFGGVKEQLIEDFWQFLLKRVKNSFEEMIIEYNEADDENSIWLTPKKNYKNRFQSYCIYFEESERIEIAIRIIDRLTNGKQKIVLERYDELIKSKDMHSFNIQPDNGNTWFYKDFDEDFKKIHGLRKILPENRNALIDEYIKSMQSFIDETIEEVDEIEKMLS